MSGRVTHVRHLASALAFVGATFAAACQDPTATRPTAALHPTAAHRTATPDEIPFAALGAPGDALAPDAEVTGSVASRAIDPGQYACPASTPIYDLIDASVNDWLAREPGTFDLLFVRLLADAVTFRAPLLYATEATPQRFGVTGEFTNVMSRTERDVKKFWDVDGGAIHVVAAHGTVLLDTAQVAGVYRTLYGVPAGPAAQFAQIVHDAVRTSTVANGGDHPLFSFNALSSRGSAGLNVPPKIVMGDGFLEGFAALGLGDVAPQAILAHEYAHQIQFARGYVNDPRATTGSTAERTRYVELMADAYSAYYLTHARGAALNKFRVAEFLEQFYDIGDCGFADPAHHGTPNQRRAAAQFGFGVADQFQKQGHVLTAAELHALFVAAYPQIIAPDAP